MKEYLDLVDENNKPLGKNKLRKDVHRDGDWHRTAHVWVLNHNNEILCNLRSPEKDLFPSHWDMIFGGHIASGESIKATALRELNEELNIEARPEDLKSLGVYKLEVRENHLINREFIYAFLLKIDIDIKKLNWQKEEISMLKFVSIEELKHINMKFVPIKEYHLSVLEKIGKK